mgnify:CR=1 FL=1
MDAALMGAIVIACCFAAGVFETGRNEEDVRGIAPQSSCQRKGGPR